MALLLSAPSFGAASRSPDACSLLRSDEISRVIGAPVDAGKAQEASADEDGAASTVCLWLIDESPGPKPDPSAPLGGRSFVILNVHRWPPQSDRARSFLDAFRLAAERGEIPHQVEARKFGDEALWWGDGLAVRKGRVSFGLSIFTPRLIKGSTGAREEKLAPFILKRLAAAQNAASSAQ